MNNKNCLGSQLPSAIPRININSTVDFRDYCLIVEQYDEVLLSEYAQPRNTTQSGIFYWTILEADSSPLFICSLDKFVERTENSWEGRCADYVVVGMYQGDCYLVVVELRKRMTTSKQFENPKRPKKGKKWQVENTIQQIVSKFWTMITQHHHLVERCSKVDQFKLLGLVIPPIQSKSRGEQSAIVTIDGYSRPVPILTIPNTQIQNCRITWSKLLESVLQ